MMPRVSPSGPIKRTSFAVISSLSNVSLSLALIVQHLQAKKIAVQRQSLRTVTACSQASGNPYQPRSRICAGVRAGGSASFFTVILYHFFLALSIGFSKKIIFIFREVSYDILSIVKSNKKTNPNHWKILRHMFFHKNFRRFSSLLNIYKSPRMRYNIYAGGNRRQVPFVAHCKAPSCEMPIL